MRHCIITGATGSLGSEIVLALTRAGTRVSALSRDPRKAVSRFGDFVKVYHYSSKGIVEAIATEPADAAIHCACSYDGGELGHPGLIKANVLEPLEIAIAAGCNIGHWIFVSTSLPPSVSPYALSKHQFTEWLNRIPPSTLPKRSVVALEHIYGPGESPRMFLTRLVRECLSGNPIDLTAGYQRRDFLHRIDAASAITTIAKYLPAGFTQTVSVGSGRSHSIREVAERVHRMTASKGTLNFGAIPLRDNEPEECVADPTLIQNMGWSPTIQLEDGLRELVTYENERRKDI